jgi:hypothetical protein
MQTTKTSALYIAINHLYILSHPSIHKNPLPGGFLCIEGAKIQNRKRKNAGSK